MKAPHTVMQDTDVAELRDLALLSDRLGKKLASLRARRDKLIASRTLSTERQVTDHAVVRFLERIDGVDMDLVRDRIRKFSDECASGTVKGVHLHPSGKQVLINSHGVIVTILPDDHDPYEVTG